MACRLGKENLAKMLIQTGANVNAQDNDYISTNCAPLHCATEKGHIGICEMLLNNGANIEAEVKFGHVFDRCNLFIVSPRNTFIPVTIFFLNNLSLE